MITNKREQLNFFRDREAKSPEVVLDVQVNRCVVFGPQGGGRGSWERRRRTSTFFTSSLSEWKKRKTRFHLDAPLM